MKPIILTICGWGPYKDKTVIDLRSFSGHGLFLITGPTGAGKTTIFDAICYALYGDMSGNVRSKDTVRSDFAAAQVPTYVELLMSHEGKEYTIYRNPTYLRPKKRKGGDGTDTVKEPEKAILTKPDGKSIEGNKEVNLAVRSILSMDFEQFRQISMIAQGEFTKLLTASAKEKTQIFRDIFGTHKYEAFARILRERSSLLYQQVITIRNRMDETIEMVGAELAKYEEWQNVTGSQNYHYPSVLAVLKELSERQTKELHTARESLTQADTKVITCNNLYHEALGNNALFTEYDNARKTKDLLNEKEEEMNRLRNTLDRAAKATEVEPLFLKKEQVRKACSEGLQQIKEQQIQIKTLEEKQLSSREQIQKQDLVKEKLQLLLEYVQKQEEQICKQSEYHEKEASWLRLCENYKKGELVVAESQNRYENAQKLYLRAMAGIMAEELVTDEPCPVCGSLQHPMPAQKESDTPTQQQIDHWKQIYEEDLRKLNQLHERTVALRTECEALKSQIQAIEGEITLKTETITGISDTIAKESLKLAEAFIGQGLIEKILNGTMTGQAWSHKIRQAMQSQEQFLNRAIMEQSELTTRQEMLGKLEIEQKKRQELEADTLKVFTEKLKQLEIDSEEAFLQIRLDAEQRNKIQMQLDDYLVKKSANEDHMRRLTDALKEKKQIDITLLQQKLDQALNEKQMVQEAYDRVRLRTETCIQATRTLTDKLEAIKRPEQDYGVMKDLDNLTSGNNPKRLVFEQFVLAGYFDQVLEAANIRLHKMTGGRYVLSRMMEVVDGRSKDNFELQVLDHNTGKKRPAKTLSGGETFKVSLSLALGMSDIVQAANGGVKVETLFIDEGFGSLDSQSLDQACETLNSLVEKERFIGIISHVQELKERIPRQLSITRTNDGSSVNVIV